MMENNFKYFTSIYLGK